MGNVSVTYRRIHHAAHYEAPPSKFGHDLEQWDVVGDLSRGQRTGDPVAPSVVPCDAEYHSGYLDNGMVQHHVFVRRAPLTGSCHHCGTAS